MMRWWVVILWLLAAGPAGADVPSAYDYAAPNLLQTLTLPNGAYQTNGYDGQGRRIAKTVLTNWNGSGYQATNLTRFVYDLSAGQAGLSAKEAGGWNLLAELDSGNGLIRSYTWGQDLSGSLEGAGGIGGLLMVKDHGDGSTHFPCYDGNGNLTALVRADGVVTARYEYGPFGEPIRATGPLAKLNPFRWSTKYWDNETDLVYYGYRYYSPSLGRWISRDRIEEEGGNNLYGFGGNKPANAYDALGAEGTLLEEEAAGGTAMQLLSAAGQGMSIYWRVRNAIDGFNAVQDALFRIATTDSADEVFDVLLGLSQDYVTQKLTGATTGAALQVAGKALSAAGRMLTIRNFALAGKAHPKTGIRFDANGYPDFSPVAKKTVRITQTGNRPADFAAANRAAGYSHTPPGYVWHHHQDGQTMILVPDAIHEATGHTGGASLVK